MAAPSSLWHAWHERDDAPEHPLGGHHSPPHACHNALAAKPGRGAWSPPGAPFSWAIRSYGTTWARAWRCGCTAAGAVSLAASTVESKTVESGLKGSAAAGSASAGSGRSAPHAALRHRPCIACQRPQPRPRLLWGAPLGRASYIALRSGKRAGRAGRVQSIVRPPDNRPNEDIFVPASPEQGAPDVRSPASKGKGGPGGVPDGRCSLMLVRSAHTIVQARSGITGSTSLCLLPRSAPHTLHAPHTVKPDRVDEKKKSSVRTPICGALVRWSWPGRWTMA
jgi:hypothetical protein